MLQKAANLWSVSGVNYPIMYLWPQVPHITPIDQVTSLPAQTQDPLTICYNLIYNYPLALLWVAHTNLVLYPPASMPQHNLGVH